MKIIKWFFVVCIALFSINVIAKPPLPIPNNTPEKPLNRIVAVVNSEIITQNDLDRAVMMAEKQLSQNGMPPPDKKTLEKRTLKQLIFMKLQLQIANKNNITASKKEVDEAIGRLAAQNKISVKALKSEIKREGISYTYFRNQIKKQIIISKLQEKAVAPTVKVTKEEIQKYREKHKSELNPTEYHIANILIPVKSNATSDQIQQAKAKAEALLKKLRGGANFDETMEQYPGSSNLGWRSPDDLPTLFASAVSKLKTGEIAGPLKAANGYHIIKLLGKRSKKPKLSKEQIQNIIFQEKLQKAVKKWLLKLHHSSYVHINVESLKDKD